MQDVVKTTILGLFFGTFGTTIGGILGIIFKNISNKFLGFVLSFASGLMLSIVCFDLIPEALEITGISLVLFAVLFGIITMLFCDILVQKKFTAKGKANNKVNSLLRTGIVVSIGLAIHNFPEGLAIRSRI